MIPERRHDIIKRAVSGVCTLFFNGFTQLGFESLFTLLLHLRFCKCFFLPAGILAVIRFADGMRQTMLHTLTAEIFRHFIKITLIPPESFSRIAVAVADHEMRMDMLPVGMHGKQHIKALAVKKTFCKFLCDLKCLLVCQAFVVIRMKGNTHLVGKIFLPADRLSPHPACEQYLLCKAVTIAVKRKIQVIRCLDNTLCNLLRIASQNVITGTAKLLYGFTGLVINIHVTEHGQPPPAISEKPKSPP